MKTSYLPLHHALLYSYIVKNCITELGENCIPSLKEITVLYGKHRAARMAKRAIYDGCKCDALTYLSYGELDVPTEIISRKTDLNGISAVSVTTKCPWFDAWKEEGHLEYGKLFCEVFDEALAAGFGEFVNMKVPCTLTTGTDHCEFIFENSNFTDEDVLLLSERNSRLKKSATKPFLYHMRHLYWFMKKELCDRYKEHGKLILKNAMDEYEKRFGKEVIRQIIEMENTDFTSIADYVSLNQR